jgi:hypothetical protein
MNSQVYLQAITNDTENTLWAEVSAHGDVQMLEVSIRSTATDEGQKVEANVSSEAGKTQGMDNEDEGYETEEEDDEESRSQIGGCRD